MMTRTFARIALPAALVAALAAPAFAQHAATPRLDRPDAKASDIVAGTGAVPVPVPQAYRIGPDDVLEVGYWRDKDMSAQVAVRPDGFISLPLLEDVAAIGLTPAELANRIRARAAEYLESPNVTVVVKQINSRKVFITGEVPRPGVYMLTGPTTVLQLIAMAGGLTEFADRERIAIIRTEASGPVTYAFNYKKALKLERLQDNILLAPGDTVLVR